MTEGEWRSIRFSGFLLALLIAAPASAGTLVRKVVGVVDGDTVHVLDAGRHTHKVRIAGIDAPEQLPSTVHGPV